MKMSDEPAAGQNLPDGFIQFKGVSLPAFHYVARISAIVENVFDGQLKLTA